MANFRNRLLPLLATLSFTLCLALSPFARADDTGGLAPPAGSEVANEGYPAAPAPDTGGSLDSEPAAAEKPAKKAKKHAKKKAKKEKKHAKKKAGKKHGKKKHKRHAD